MFLYPPKQRRFDTIIIIIIEPSGSSGLPVRPSVQPISGPIDWTETVISRFGPVFKTMDKYEEKKRKMVSGL